jgi:glycosyltransferase involved in cell wall biosynthesis
LRIAIFAEYFPPRMGSDRRIYELMKRNAKKHKINFLLIPSFCELRGILKTENHKSLATCTYTHEGIVTYRLEIPRMVKKLWRKSLELAYLFSMVLFIPKAIKKLVEIGPEIIILNYPSVHTGMLGFFVAKILRKPCVVDFNDLIAQYTIRLLNLKRRSLSGRMIVFVQDFIVKNSNLVVAPTNFIRKYALALGMRDEKISVIPNGADTQIFNAQRESNYRSKLNLHNKKVCIYFGRLDGWAGVHILAEVCNIFEQTRPDVKFLIVGSGIEQVKFPGNAIIINEIPHYEVPKMIAIADVVLVPFPENEVSHAASPLKLFEGMAMGKTVIASRVSGIQEVVQSGYNGFLVNPNNPKDWCETIEAVLDCKSLQVESSRKALESVKKYDWNVLAALFECTLLKLIEGED